MTAKVYVSGFGVFSAFGFGPEALFDGVFSGSPAFRMVTRFDVSHCRTGQAATYPEAAVSPPDAGPGLETVEVAIACRPPWSRSHPPRSPSGWPIASALGGRGVPSSTPAAPRQTRSSTERSWSGPV